MEQCLDVLIITILIYICNFVKIESAVFIKNGTKYKY